MRKLITDHSTITPDEVFTGSIDDVLIRIANIRDRIISKYSEAADDVISIESDYVGYDGEQEFWVSFVRFETDAEVEAREAKEEKERARKIAAAQRKLLSDTQKKEKKEQQERELYEMLKAKFEK